MNLTKRILTVISTIIMVLAISMLSYAAGGRKVYWGINGDTLVLSCTDTGCTVKGSFNADKAYNPEEGRPWVSYRDVITKLVVDGSAGKVKIKDCMDLFYNLNNLTSADLSGLDTSETISLWCLFDACSSLKSVDVSMLDTSKVTNMQGMFYKCSSLESADLSNFDTSHVTTMYKMFADCSSLKSVDLSSFDMSKVTYATDMFANCDKLTEIKTGAGWNANGEPNVSSWKKIKDGVWYGIDMHGNKLAGWHKLWWDEKENWYYFSKEPGASYGVCQLGGTTPDGYFLAATGEWIE